MVVYICENCQRGFYGEVENYAYCNNCNCTFYCKYCYKDYFDYCDDCGAFIIEECNKCTKDINKLIVTDQQKYEYLLTKFKLDDESVTTETAKYIINKRHNIKY